MHDTTKKTSNEWQKICIIKILDADGWDMGDFDYSWYEELITKTEFEKRLSKSTILSYPIFDKKGNVNNIWKDNI